MTKIDLGYDLGEQERDGGSDLIEAGDYLCELARVKYVDGKDGKFDQILLTIRILDAANEDQKKFIGNSFLEGVSMSEKARWRVTQLVDAVYGRKVEGTSLDLNDLIERRLVVRTMVDEYNGKVRTRTDRFLGMDSWNGSPDAEPVKKVNSGKAKASAADEEEVDL